MFGFLIIVDLMFMGGGNSFVYDPDYKVCGGKEFGDPQQRWHFFAIARFATAVPILLAPRACQCATLGSLFLVHFVHVRRACR
jgi:hypothetical protein